MVLLRVNQGCIISSRCSGRTNGRVTRLRFHSDLPWVILSLSSYSALHAPLLLELHDEPSTGHLREAKNLGMGRDSRLPEKFLGGLAYHTVAGGSSVTTSKHSMVPLAHRLIHPSVRQRNVFKSAGLRGGVCKAEIPTRLA